MKILKNEVLATLRRNREWLAVVRAWERLHCRLELHPTHSVFDASDASKML